MCPPLQRHTEQFHSLNVLWAPPFTPGQTTAALPLSRTLPVPERQVAGVTPCAAFSVWFLPRRHVHLTFLLVFSRPGSSFLLSANVPLSEWTTVYLPIHLPKDILVILQMPRSVFKLQF